MSCYRHLTIEEREKLSIGISKKESMRECARKLGRNVSTISRELKRNEGNQEEYLPCKAQQAYEERRKKSVRKKKLLVDKKLHETVHYYIVKQNWTPEIIAERLKKEVGRCVISASSIYRALENGVLQDTLKPYLPYKYKKIGKAGKKCKKYIKTHSIDDRPAIVAERGRPMDWEGDLVAGYRESTMLLTLVDRLHRTLLMCLVPSKEAVVVAQAVIRLLSALPHQVNSITFDQGTEFSACDMIEDALACKVYYAHPHAPWERPSSENINGLLRRTFIPKRTKLSSFSDSDIARFQSIINFRPRKCLNWLSPLESSSHSLLRFT